MQAVPELPLVVRTVVFLHNVVLHSALKLCTVLLAVLLSLWSCVCWVKAEVPVTHLFMHCIRSCDEQ